jgi:hypothetical protein
VGWTLAPLGFASLGLIRDVLHPSELPTAAAITAAVFAASLGLHRAHSRGRIILNRRSR